MHLKFLIPAVFVAATLSAAAQSTPARPKITGISHLAVYHVGRRGHRSLLP